MEDLLLALVQFLGEILLQVFAEVIAEVGLRGLVAPFRRTAPAWLASIGYALLGGVVGGVSLWLVPSLFIEAQWGRIANVVVTPMVAGAAMAALGAWRVRRGQRVILLDRFAYGFLFAFVMAVVRLKFGA